MRDLANLFPFILSGVLDDNYVWMLKLAIDWRSLCHLARRVTAASSSDVQELERLVKLVKPGFLALYRLFKDNEEANLDGHPTYHMLDHLGDMVRHLGDLNDASTDYFERCHVALKEIFVHNTNHSRVGDKLMPQMMRGWGVRLLDPLRVCEKRRLVVQEDRLEVRMIGRGARQELAKVMEGHSAAFAKQVRRVVCVHSALTLCGAAHVPS
jgi:hypothetical protein